MSENKSSHLGASFNAFAIGALVGAGIALLYAPCSGRETREFIANKGRALKGRAQHTLENAKGYFDSRKADISAAFEAGRDAMHEERVKHQKSA